MSDEVKIRSRRDGGFSLIEILVALSIVLILSVLVAPELLGAREKSRQGACQSALHVADAELVNELASLEAAGDENAALGAIDIVVARTTASGVRNPRNLAQPGYVRVESPIVPTLEQGCQVFLYDATGPEEFSSPIIVVTHWEDEVRSFRIALG